MLKRLTAFLLLLTILFSFVACGDSKCKHEFDNDCDVYCNKKGCNYMREIEHQFEYDCQSECSVEGCDFTRDASHEYDDACDLTCNICGEKRKNDEHYCFNSIDNCDCISFDKTAFEAALRDLVIKDGEFTLDDAVREEKVLENIYAAIADAVGNSTENQKKEGKPSIRDVVYYTYYATAIINGEEHTFYANKMKNTSPSKIQLNENNDYGDNELSSMIAALFKDVEFEKRDMYAIATSGKAYEGDIAFVSYTKLTRDDNNAIIKSENFTNTIVKIGEAPEEYAAATTLESYLSGKSIGSSIDKIEISDGGVTYVYSSIKINYVASRIYNGETKTGDKAYVSYTVKNKDGDGKTKTVINELVIVGNEPTEGATAASLAEYIARQEIGKYIDGSFKLKQTITVKDEYGSTIEREIEVEYSNVKINWVASESDELYDRAAGSIVFVPYGEDEDEVRLVDTAGREYIVNGVEFTYHIFPVYYIETPEYTTELLIDKIYGEDLTADIIYQLIFIQDYLDLPDNASEKEINEINKKAENYKSGNLTINDLVKAIVLYYTDIEDAQRAYENALDAKAEAEDAYNSAEMAYYNAIWCGEDPDSAEVKALKDALYKASVALYGEYGEDDDHRTGAIANLERAEKLMKQIEEQKAENIAKLLSIKNEQGVTLNEIIYNNYKVLNYSALQDAYNEEIRMNLAKEIKYFLDEYTEVSGVIPQKAVSAIYTRYYNEYKKTFIDSKSSKNDYENYYKLYNGNFDQFFIERVGTDFDTPCITLEEAETALLQAATEEATELMKIYAVANAYGVKITKADYKEYKKELEDYYYYYVFYHKDFDLDSFLGATTMELACQFDKLINYFLAYEEIKGEPDGNGYVRIIYNYTKFYYYTFGKPASSNGYSVGCDTDWKSISEFSTIFR